MNAKTLVNGPLQRKQLAIRLLKDNGADRAQKAYGELLKCSPGALDQAPLSDEKAFRRILLQALRAQKISYTNAHHNSNVQQGAVWIYYLIILQGGFAAGYRVSRDFAVHGHAAVHVDLDISAYERSALRWLPPRQYDVEDFSVLDEHDKNILAMSAIATVQTRRVENDIYFRRVDKCLRQNRSFKVRMQRAQLRGFTPLDILYGENAWQKLSGGVARLQIPLAFACITGWHFPDVSFTLLDSLATYLQDAKKEHTKQVRQQRIYDWNHRMATSASVVTKSRFQVRKDQIIRFLVYDKRP